MDLFKKLDVVRRRNERSGSVVSDDGLDDDNGFCYHQHDQDNYAGIVEDVIEVVGAPNDSSNGSSSSLYGRRRNTGYSANTCPPMMAVVTSTKFDRDETFSAVARAMIHRYHDQNMSEREAILGALGNGNDLPAFIEALDQKFIVLSTQNTDDATEHACDDDALSEIVLKTRSIFYATLKAMWREKELSGTIGQEESLRQHRDEIVSNHEEEYRKHHPKTPKNLHMSPMRTSAFNYKNHGFISQSESLDSACSEGSNSSMFRPFKRPRRWFFPQNNKKERLVTPPRLSCANKISPVTNNDAFPVKAALPKFHFDFGKTRTSKKNNSILFGDLSRGPMPVQFLQLEGPTGDGNGSEATYMPPTSPIRNVSIEMKLNGNNSAAA